MSVPATIQIAGLPAIFQFTQRHLDNGPMRLLDQFQRQAGAGLTPGGIGELLPGQMPHRRAGDIPMGHLLDKEPQGVAGGKGGVAKEDVLATGQLIDTLRQQKIIRAIMYACQGKIERCHPWPPVKEMGVVEQHHSRRRPRLARAIITCVMAQTYVLT